MSGRTAASVALAMLALGIASVIGWRWVLSLPHPVPLEIERNNAPFAFAGMFAFSLVGALILSRRPTHRIGWLYAIAGPLVGMTAFTTAYAQYGHAVPGVLPAAGLMDLISGFSYFGGFFGPVTVGLLLFPDGKLPSAHWRVVAAAVVLAFLSISAQAVLQAAGQTSFLGVGKESVAGAINGAIVICVVAALIGSVASIIQRWRTSRGDQRQQIKWVGAAGLNFLIVLIFVLAFFEFLQEWGFFIVTFAYSLIPVAAGIAILRYRLYEIDLLIKRTVVYGATTAAIAATFFLGIVALQALLRPLTSGSEVAVAASTLASFTLFQPIRRSVQAAVDRRFDRSRYDAARTVDEFAGRLRDEVDLDALKSELLVAVSRTMSPAHSSLWLRERAR
jgi:hypothetical protein